LKRLRLFILSVAFSLVACAPSNPTKLHNRPASVATDETASTVASQQVVAAEQLLADKNWPEALSALKAIVDARSFSTLDSDFQYKVLMISASTALDHGQPQLAYGYLVRATSMPQATIGDWLARLRAAETLKNTAGTVGALTVIVQRQPDQVSHFNDDSVIRVILEAKELPDGSVLPLLQGLYDAHWKLKWDREPSALWRDLALGLIEKEQLSQANDVAAHVTDPYVLITMRADRRFDALVAANPAQFDIVGAADREIQALQAASEGAPRSLELKWRLVGALLSREHYDAALAASDSVLSDIRSTNFPERLYDDFVDQRSTFLAFRATALERVGRWDEAVAQLSAASLLNEKYSGNVDQIIQLGDLYCELGRPSDGLSAIGKLVAKTNAFGTMQIEHVRLDAAIQLGDSKQAGRSLAYMRRHRADAPYAYQDALLIADHIDRAAAELIGQLLDKGQRQQALLGVQVFLPTPDTSRGMELEARRRAIINRPDVQAAIQKVGRVERYALGNEW
jgi:beta-barrel assembly-enhancing protease